MQHKRLPISAFIICRNEEKNICRCLESLQWCDEIVVVDSGSTDRTIELSKQYTPHVHHYKWQGYAAQKELAQSLCSHEWVINIDADEEVTPRLRDSILEMLTIGYSKSSQLLPNGYYVQRVVYFLNQWWERACWFPEYRLRVYRKSKGSWIQKPVHEKLIIEGTTSRLRGTLQHYTYTNLSEHVAAANRYSKLMIPELKARKVKFAVVRMLIHPVARFLKLFFFKRGFLHGSAGFIVSCIEAFYVFLKYAKLWELQAEEKLSRKVARSKKPDPVYSEANPKASRESLKSA